VIRRSEEVRTGKLVLPVASVQASQRAWPWRIIASLLILGSAALHIAYLACSCPLDLAPDEAHYWDWSRHLDWSYYSKGPLVAYLIRLGCLLAGGWARSMTGNEMLAVRLPAVCCGGLMLIGLYVLAVQVYQREKLGLAVVAAALVMPPVIAGATLMTIDAPYTCCWTWSLVLGHRAIFNKSSWAWAATGLVVGLGILAKYTMLLWFPSFGLFLLLRPEYRRLFLRPGPWIMTAVAGVLCFPILIWNMQHHWVSFRHVSGQAGIEPGLGIRWLGPLEYVAIQAALLLGFWFLVWLRALWQGRHSAMASETYLWSMSVVTFCLFLAFSIRTSEEPNWPVAGYLSGLVLAMNWLGVELGTQRLGYRRLLQSSIAGTSLLGLVLIAFMHHSEWVHPVLAGLAGPPTLAHPLPARTLDPTCRLRGWRTLAEALDRCRARLEAQGLEPVLAGTSWTIPGEVGFYCAGHPTVYSLGLALGDRHSQYDLWRPNPVDDAECFRRRTFIVVGEVPPSLCSCFEVVDPVEKIEYRVNGLPVAQWSLTVCRAFKGMQSLLPAGASY
jgi:4-amino-4-deoxy-L-arabinose transferase-like glycosyltransferase